MKICFLPLPYRSVFLLLLVHHCIIIFMWSFDSRTWNLGIGSMRQFIVWSHNEKLNSLLSPLLHFNFVVILNTDLLLNTEHRPRYVANFVFGERKGVAIPLSNALEIAEFLKIFDQDSCHYSRREVCQVYIRRCNLGLGQTIKHCCQTSKICLSNSVLLFGNITCSSNIFA